jgi:hypothetical protein
MSSHQLVLIPAGALGVGGKCSSPDGCDWFSTRWRASEQWVRRDHNEHIEQEEQADG